MGPVRELMQKVPLLERASVRSPQGNDLAEFAAAAPGTCAYRALRSAIPALADEKDALARSTLFAAALAIGNTITRLFQRRAAVAIVEATRWNQKARTGGACFGFCQAQDLQSVLDEYVFLLVRDSAERDPHTLAHEVAAVVELALRTVGGLQVVRPKPKKNDASYGAAMYARALGEHDSIVDEDLKAANKEAAKKKKGNARREEERKEGREEGPTRKGLARHPLVDGFQLALSAICAHHHVDRVGGAGHAPVLPAHRCTGTYRPPRLRWSSEKGGWTAT